MTAFRSNEEFFKAVEDLIAKLEEEGHHQAAIELKEGFGCLNGLTDGWALFLESITRVEIKNSKQFTRKHRKALEAVRAAASAAVSRR